MYKATVKDNFSKLDQRNMYLKFQEWKQQQQQNYNFCLRGYGGKLAKNEEVNDRNCEEVKV